MHVFVKEKKMPSLNTRTWLSITGTTADWCPVSCWLTLHKDLEQHVEALQKSWWVESKYCWLGVPAFLLCKNKMQMPKMSTLMNKQGKEFIDNYERLCQCIVFELADDNWEWFWLITNDYMLNGPLKWVISWQESILELSYGQQKNYMTVRFLKFFKL